MVRRGDVGEAGAMERTHQEIARAADAVACEHTAGSVSAMRGRRKPDDQQARARVAETGHGAAPVDFVAKGATLLARDARAVLAQTWAPFARDDGLAHCSERRVV